jgi:hypothetical protein
MNENIFFSCFSRISRSIFTAAAKNHPSSGNKYFPVRKKCPLKSRKKPGRVAEMIRCRAKNNAF